MLSSVSICPVCGDSERTLSANGIASIRKDSGKHYLKGVAEIMQITVNQLIEKIKVYQCSNCNSYYCDPWLNTEAAALIFNEESSDHMAGWANFEHWLSSERLNKVEYFNSILYKNLVDKIGSVLSYGEYGCPFQGFLLLFRRLELAPKERINIFSSSIYRRVDVRMSTGARLHNVTQNLAHMLVIIYHWLRFIKEKKFTQIDQIGNLPTTRKLFLRRSTKAWGNNCVRYSASCTFYASKLLEAEVLPFGKGLCNITNNSESSLDLLGIFNILDHEDDPLNIVVTSLKFAKHIIIVTHKAEVAGKQHLFAFHKSFPVWLQSILTDAYVTDLTHEMEKMGHYDYNCTLISRS